MADRVLASGEATQKLQKLSHIIESDLPAKINEIVKLGESLTERESWDGNRANQFRSSQWPQSKKALEGARQVLIELDQIATAAVKEILAAGGNG